MPIGSQSPARSGRRVARGLRSRALALELAARDLASLLRAAWVTWRRGGAREVGERLRAKLARTPASAAPAPVARFDERLARRVFPPLALPACAEPVASIVIPAHGAYAHTFLCLETIAAAGDRTPYEVIVVDDASADRTAAIEGDVANLRVVRNAENLGFVDSANRGAAAARGRLLVFLNNDTAVCDGWLDALVEAFASVPEAGLVGARLLHADGRLQESGGILWRDASGWNFGRDDAPDRPEYTRRRDVDYCSGACLATPRALFESLGGFDLRYRPAYYEDADLAFRVRAAGRRVLVEPASTVIHFEGASAGTDLARGMKRHQVVNRERFAERWAADLAERPPAPPESDARRAPYRGRRAHVLVVESRVPDPEHDAGSLRLARIFDLLAELGATVTLVPADRAAASVHSRALERRGVEVFTRPWLRSIPSHLRERGSLYDVVWLSRKHLAAKYLHHARRHCPEARLVFDTVDLHFLRESRQLAVEGRDSAPRAARLEREELALVRACDATLVVTDVERDLLRAALPEADVRVVSTIHDPHPAGPGFGERSGGIFIGSFEHEPNVDAMRWYLEAIHPRVVARCPDFELCVIGTDAPAWLLDWRAPGVHVVGAVAHLDPHFDRARLSIAPLRFGAGVKGKIQTSHSYGVPTVATALAVEGMHLADGDSVLLADDPDAFAGAVARLHGDAALWERLSAGARRNLVAHFSTGPARTVLDGLLADLVPSRRRLA